MKWQSRQPGTVESLGSKSQLYTALEGLVLDLQVLSEDLRNSQGMLTSIVRCLQALEVSVQVPLQDRCTEET